MRFGENLQPHVGACDAAEFRTLAAVDARFRRVEEDAVFAPGDHVDLAREGRHPEAVDHIRSGRDEVDAGAHRHMDLVGRHRARARISNLPPPLVADHVDRQLGAARARGRARADHVEVRCGEQRQERRQRDRDAEQQHHAARDVLALAEERQPGGAAAQPGEHEQPDRAEEHNHRRAEHPPPQQRDELGLLAARGQRRLLAATAVARHDDDDQGQSGEHP